MACEFAINGDARDNQMLMLLLPPETASQWTARDGFHADLLGWLPPAVAAAALLATTTSCQANEAIMRRDMFASSL